MGIDEIQTGHRACDLDVFVHDECAKAVVGRRQGHDPDSAEQGKDT